MKSLMPFILITGLITTLSGCTVLAVADTVGSVAVGTVGLAADAAIGTVKIAGKVVGKTADVITGMARTRANAEENDMSTEIAYDKEVDASGLRCPLPILRAKKALTDMLSGQVLKVISTDPGSVRDFQAFAKQTGNELVSQVKLDEQSWMHALKRR